MWFLSSSHYGIEGVLDGDAVVVSAVSECIKSNPRAVAPNVGTTLKQLKCANSTFVYKLRIDPCPDIQPVAVGDQSPYIRRDAVVPFASLDEFMAGEWYKKPQNQCSVDHLCRFASTRDEELANVKVLRPLMSLMTAEPSEATAYHQELSSVIDGVLPLDVIKFMCWGIGKPKPGIRVCPYPFAPDIVKPTITDAALYYKMVRGETHCQLSEDGSVVLKLVDEVWKEGYISLWSVEDFNALPQSDKWTQKAQVESLREWGGDPSQVGLPADFDWSVLDFILDPSGFGGDVSDKVLEVTGMTWFRNIWNPHNDYRSFDDAYKAYQVGLDVPDCYSVGGITLIQELTSNDLLDIDNWKDLLKVATTEEVKHMGLTSFKVLNEATDYDLTCATLYNAAMGADSKEVITALRNMSDDELNLMDFLRPNRDIFDEFTFEMITDAASQTDTSAPTQQPCPIKDIKQFLRQAKKVKPLLDLVRKQVAKVLKETEGPAIETEMCYWYISTHVNTRFPQVSRLEALEIIDTGGYQFTDGADDVFSYLYLHQKFFAKCTSDSILANVEQAKGQPMRMTMSMVALYEWIEAVSLTVLYLDTGARRPPRIWSDSTSRPVGPALVVIVDGDCIGAVKWMEKPDTTKKRKRDPEQAPLVIIEGKLPTTVDRIKAIKKLYSDCFVVKPSSLVGGARIPA